MSFYRDRAFGGNWDMGQFVSDNLIMYPIQKWIESLARQDGIDVSNPSRQMATACASAWGGWFLGSFLGPVGAIFGSIFGILAGMAGKFPDDRPQRRPGRVDVYTGLRMTAFREAIKALDNHTTRERWNSICDEVWNRIKRYERQEPQDPRAAFEFARYHIEDAIRSVNYNAYNNFNRVYNTILYEMGL